MQENAGKIYSFFFSILLLVEKIYSFFSSLLSLVEKIF